MQKDHRPYYIKKAYLAFQRFYVRRFLRPQFARLGIGTTFMKPWHVELFGAPISMGDYANVVATSDNKVRLSVWSESPARGRITIGRYCFIGPGVRITSAAEIILGDSCMLAANVYITDSDWHGVYNRVSLGAAAPVFIRDNVWIGDHAIVRKGITIGRNSIVGAGSVVTADIPDNVIAAGNPARIIRELDPTHPMTTRRDWFADPRRLEADIDIIDRRMLAGNTLLQWRRHLAAPRRGD